MKKRLIAGFMACVLILCYSGISVYANSDSPPKIAITDTNSLLNFENDEYVTEWCSGDTVKITAEAGASAISGISYVRGDEDTETFTSSNNITVGVSSDGVLKYSDIYAIDIDGNVSESYNLTIRVDSTAPEINSFTNALNEKGNQDTIKCVIFDETSGIEKVLIEKFNNIIGQWEDISEEGSKISLEKNDKDYVGTMNVTENGTYRLTVIDKAKNTSTQLLSITDFNEDAPFIKVAVTGNNLTVVSDNNFIAKDASVSITGIKNKYDLSTVNYTLFGDEQITYGSSVDFSLMDEKSYSITDISVGDTKGNVSYANDMTVNIDQTAPHINSFECLYPNLEKNQLDGINYDNSAILSLEATDNFMIKEVKWFYSKDGAEWNILAENDNLSKNDEGSYLLSQNISKNGYYCVQVIDYVNFDDTSAIIKVDSIDIMGPDVTLQADRPSSNGWFVDEVEISFDCYDEQSGVDYITFALDGNTEYDALYTNFWTDQSCILNYIVYDKLGNSTSGKMTIFIDKSNPSLSITVPDTDQFVKSENVTYIANDTNSGIDTTYLEVYKSNVWKTYSFGNQSIFSLTDNGIYRIKTIDLAGRITISNTFTIANIDNTLPFTAEITAIENSWDTKCNIGVLGVDEYSGVKSIEVFNADEYGVLNEASPVVAVYNEKTNGVFPLSTVETFTIDKNGKYLLVVSDGADNVKTKIFTVSNIDLNKPTISNVAISTRDWINSSISLFIEANDDESGIKGFELQKLADDGETWQSVN